jgi:hypothetical protein
MGLKKKQRDSIGPSAQKRSSKQRYLLARYRWLTPVILVTQEAERKMVVGSQSVQIVHETLSRKYQYKTGWVEWLK